MAQRDGAPVRLTPPPHHEQCPWTWSSQNPTGTPVRSVVTSLGYSGLSLVVDDLGSFEDAGQVLRRMPLVGLMFLMIRLGLWVLGRRPQR